MVQIHVCRLHRPSVPRVGFDNWLSYVLFDLLVRLSNSYQHFLPVIFYDLLTLRVQKLKVLLSSKSQFVPTRKHTNLGCGSLQAKRCPNRGAARFKPSARFIHINTKRYMPYHRNVIYNPSNIQLQKTRSQAKLNWNGVVEQQLGEKPLRTSTCT